MDENKPDEIVSTDDTLLLRLLDIEVSAPEAAGDCLVVLAGSRVGEMVRLPDALLIGRAAHAELLIRDPGLSKEHIRIERQPDGSVVARDLGSTNGTYVNGQPITAQTLRDGDKIHLGAATVLKYTRLDTLDAQFQQTMYVAALRDPLTGLYNRRYLMDQLGHELAYAIRHERPLSLVLLDLDHFKAVNDRYGHTVGDEVLRAVGAHILGGTREEDTSARYGGEELAVLCRDTEMEQAVLVGERLRRRIGSDVLVPAHPALRVTVSAGVASVPHTHIQDVRSLLEAADKALYAAKAAGRDRVLVFRP